VKKNNKVEETKWENLGPPRKKTEQLILGGNRTSLLKGRAKCVFTGGGGKNARAALGGKGSRFMGGQEKEGGGGLFQRD